jgi:hypothetical protein
MNDLFYAVIALKSNEVDQVIAKLLEQKKDDLAKWLTQRKAWYGKTNEEWTPFNGQSINQLINETKGYQTATPLIDTLNNSLSNVEIVRESAITIYFIDAFALYVDKYANLAGIVDFHFADNAKCCLVLSPELPVAMQDQLLDKYCSVWKQVCITYRKGNLHRVAARSDDLKNFCNYLHKLFGSKDAPNPVADRELDQRWPYHTDRPPSFATA